MDSSTKKTKIDLLEYKPEVCSLDREFTKNFFELFNVVLLTCLKVSFQFVLRGPLSFDPNTTDMQGQAVLIFCCTTDMQGQQIL